MGTDNLKDIVETLHTIKSILLSIGIGVFGILIRLWFFSKQ